VPNVCSYTTLVKMNNQISMCLTTDTCFVSTKLVFDPDTISHECPWRTLWTLLA